MGLSRDTVDKMITARFAPLQAKIAQLERARDELKASNWYLKSKMGLLERRIDDGDQYSRRQNLLIDGIPLRKHEKPEDIRRQVMNEIRNLDLDIDEIELDRAHRAEEPYEDNKGRWCQPVIARFVSWDPRNEVYQARKDSKFKFRAHLTPRRELILNYACEQIAKHSFISEKIDFAFADKNCSLQVRAKDGRFLGFSSELEFDGLAAYLDCSDSRKKKVLDEVAMKYEITYYTNEDVISYPKLELVFAESAPDAPEAHSNDEAATSAATSGNAHDKATTPAATVK